VNRKELLDREGATRATDFSWSAVVKDKKRVLISAWVDEIESAEGGKRVFSESWQLLESGRKNPNYRETLSNLNLVLQEGYRLFTFSMHGKRDLNGKVQIVSVEDNLSESFLVCDGDDYFAIPIGISSEGLDHQSGSASYLEGESYQVLQTKYERSLDARRDCLAQHGYSCAVCKFNFETRYGKLGKDYIHVHHLVRVAERLKPYTIDGKLDLRPLCPNCHAMVHKKIPPYSIEEMKTIVHEIELTR
jgi:5-methylcytosine-specific restriction enzyme A